MPKSLHKRILKLLSDERHAIANGAYTELTALGETKVMLFNMLLAVDMDSEDMQSIRLDLDHNQSLLSSAIDGVAAARARLSALQDVRDGLSIYDESGQLSKVANVQSSMEKKA